MTVGNYRLIRLLGRGGMGVVHLAEAPGGELVALKRLPLYGSATRSTGPATACGGRPTSSPRSTTRPSSDSST